ncbi:MAG: TetR/AcrR family transcriptional regulator [Oscillospiraceae bacterium]|nr:TetR/AcrR family transcriptional regulator [Oscillospiraceae bacterium]
MPKIFTDDDRNNIRSVLLKNGRKALEKNSCKNISVAELAAEAGIAKGTFYSFFPSKEEFFYEIMLQIRDENRRELNALAEKPSYQKAYELFYSRYTCVKTVYDYFTPEELKIIFRKIPDKHSEADENSIQLAQKLISVCTDNKSIKAEVVVNLMNLAAAASANRDFFIAEHYNETIAVLSKAIADYIFDVKKEN